MPIHRGRAVICGRDGRTNQRSKCVCHPSNGHGGSSSGRFHPGQPRSRMAMQRMGVQTSQPWPHVRRLPLPTARVFFFFFFYLYFIFPLVLFDVHEMSLNFLPRTHMCRGGNTRIVSYHIGKFLVETESSKFGHLVPRIFVGREDAILFTFICLKRYFVVLIETRKCQEYLRWTNEALVEVIYVVAEWFS